MPSLEEELRAIIKDRDREIAERDAIIAKAEFLVGGVVLSPDTFHFSIPGWPCIYWTDGSHIVTDGRCRCGKLFTLTQRYRVPESETHG